MKTAATLGLLALGGLAAGQELWHTGVPADTYGIYFMVPVTLQTTGNRGIDDIRNGRRTVYNAPNMNVESKQEMLVGSIVSKVSDTVLGEYACKHYDSNYVVQGRRGTVLRNVQRRTQTWVDFKGVTRRVKSYYRDDIRIVEIDSKFEKDTIEMDIVENGKPRHMSLTPSQGIEAFNNPIPDMLKNADKDRYEKVFCTIDPTNGGIIQYTIRLKGRFVPPSASSIKVKGFSFEVKAPHGIHTVHVSDDGQLRQIDFADTSEVRATSARPVGGGGRTYF